MKKGPASKDAGYSKYGFGARDIDKASTSHDQIFVDRGFSRDIKNSENKGLYPLQSYQFGVNDHL